MYAYLKGVVAHVEADNCIIEVNNIGYNVRISPTTASMLPQVGEETKLFTYTSVREDAITLIGFLTMSELDMFRQLITVSGIGPKGGLSILSVMDADTLRFAILTGDSNTISKAPGIGKKSAERLILELKGKVDEKEILSIERPEIASSIASPVDDIVKEAAEALTALGYSSTDSMKAVKAVQRTPDMNVEDILKLALKELY